MTTEEIIQTLYDLAVHVQPDQFVDLVEDHSDELWEVYEENMFLELGHGYQDTAFSHWLYDHIASEIERADRMERIMMQQQS